MSLRFGILGLLAEKPAHGYEVKTRYEDMLGGTREINIGQVYTTLQRLERDGLIEAEGDRGDRGKQDYRVTDGGREALHTWLANPNEEPQQLNEEIYVKILLGSRLGNSSLDSLLSGQRRIYLQKIRDLSELEQRARRQSRVDLALLARGAIIHAEAELKWLDFAEAEMRNRQSAAAQIKEVGDAVKVVLGAPPRGGDEGVAADGQ